MNKISRLLSLVLVLAMSLLALASMQTVRAQSPVKLTLEGWSSSPSENKNLQSIVDAFNKANPTIQVTLNQVPEYDTTLAKDLAGGTPPDAFYVDSSRFYDLLNAKALMPIGDKLDNTSDFYPSLKATFTANGVFYCPPKDFSTLALEINTDMMTAAGIKAAPTTWDELMADAKAMSSDKVAGIAISADLARWIAFLYQSGGSVMNSDFTKMTINSPEGLAALKFYTDLYANGYAKTPSDLGASWNGEAFGQGKAAMTIEGNWIMPFMHDQYPKVNFSVAELPAGPKGKATMAFTVCYAAPSNAKHPAESIKLINYLTGSDGMKAWTDLGLAMPTRQSLSAGWVKAHPEQKTFLDGATYSHGWQFTAGFQAVIDKTNEQIQLIFAGNQTPQNALTAIDKVGNEVLSKAQGSGGAASGGAVATAAATMAATK